MALLKISFDAHSDSPTLADLPLVSDVSLVCRLLLTACFSSFPSHSFRRSHCNTTKVTLAEGHISAAGVSLTPFARVTLEL